MTPHYLPSNSSTHLRGRFRFPFGPQTAGDIVEIGYGETHSGTQQNAIAGFFDSELSARSPGT
jgi:hypothetical protein